MLKESEEFVYDTIVSIANGKNVKIEPIDLIFKSDAIICSNELLFGVLSSYHYLNIETMHIISSYLGEDNTD